MPTGDERAQLVGRYVLNPMVTLEIAALGDTLAFRQGGASLGVRMLGDDRIRVMVPSALPPVVLELVRDANGRVLYLHQGLRAIPRAETPR
jgi:hypothetical protein